MHKITFQIEPVPASRPRVGKFGTYYNKRYAQFRKDMEQLLMGKKCLYEEPLILDVIFYRMIPKSYSKKRREALDGQYIPTVPDLDNLEKALYDAMNGVIYEDDSQIVDHRVRKIWTKGDGYIEVNIERIYDITRKAES